MNRRQLGSADRRCVTRSMDDPLVSVVIPAYNNAEYLGEAIDSVLAQTYANFEVVVVNDASPDDASDVVARYGDPRVRSLVHPENRGLAAARNTGMHEARGAIIALLDGDDYFHPTKLEHHVNFLREYPEVGVTYNARFDLNHSAITVRELWRPPVSVTLADLVKGFPFAPSDMVIRRDWAHRVGGFDERYTYFGEDLDFNCRLGLAGCVFAGVDRALNYRRYHAGRRFTDLRHHQEAELQPLLPVFDDPRCPPDVRALKGQALANRFVFWTSVAMAQEQRALGLEYYRRALELDPGLVEGSPCRFLQALLTYSLLDESRSHEELLRTMSDQLRGELPHDTEQFQWAAAQGYLRLATRAAVWDREDRGHAALALAEQRNARLDEGALREIAAQLLDFETLLGSAQAKDAIARVTSLLAGRGHARPARLLLSELSMSRAFRLYADRRHARVPAEVFRAVVARPSRLADRGVWSITARSLLRTAKGSAMAADERHDQTSPPASPD